jgi:hypothetical protein
MRIGFDVAQTCSAKAGCGWVADLLARALAAEAPKDDIYLYHHFGTWFNEDTSNGTHLSQANTKEPFSLLSANAARELWTAVASGQCELPGSPDIVHANCYQAPRVGSAKLVYTVHDVSFWVYPEYTTEVNRLVCQQGILDAVSRAAGFVFVSQSTRDEFEKIFPGLCSRRNIAAIVAPHASRFLNLPSPRLEAPFRGVAGCWVAGAEKKLRYIVRCAGTILAAIQSPAPANHRRRIGLEIRKNPSPYPAIRSARLGLLLRVHFRRETKTAL